MKSFEFEIAIIGGGPAGSIAAMYLQNFGADVCIIEKKVFPRETLCGEFLSGEVIEEIKRHDLYEEFLNLNPNNIDTFRFFRNDNEICSKINFPAFGLKRSSLDNFLLNSAKGKGAVVFQPFEVKEIKRGNNLFKLKANNKNGEEINVSSRFVIAAYGKQNFLDKKLNRKFAYINSGMNGIKFHLEKDKLKNFDRREIRIYSEPGIYCGVNSVNDNHVTICFLYNRRTDNTTPREKIIDFISSCKNFGDLFDENYKKYFSTVKIYGTGNIYFGSRDLFNNGIFMVGDSARVIAPLTGDGIGMAMQSAILAAEIISNVSKGRLSFSKAGEMYNSEWKRLFNLRLKTAASIQHIILSHLLDGAGMKAIKTFPRLLPALIKLTR